MTVSFPPREPPYEPPREPTYGQSPLGPPPYGPPPFGPPPQGYPHFGPSPLGPPEKPIWKQTWFRVVAAIFVFGLIRSATGDGDSSRETAVQAAEAPTTAESAAPIDSAAPIEEVVEQPAPQPAPAGLGQPAADGDFSFVIQGVDCGLTEIGGQHFGTKAQGQFCVVSLTVTNIGNSAQTFDDDDATLLNAAGQQFSADSGAAFYLDDASSFYEEINPGNTLNSKIVFDVPAGTTPTAIELHDSAFSGGVTVSLQ